VGKGEGGGQEGRSRRVGGEREEGGGDGNEGEGVGEGDVCFHCKQHQMASAVQSSAMACWYDSVREQSLTFRYRVHSGSSAPPQMSHYPDQQLSQLPQWSQPAGSHRC